MDADIVRSVLEIRTAREADYASNTLMRTFPDGLDVEAIKAVALREAAAEANDRVEREHVTPFIYRRPERYVLAGLSNDEDLSEHRWVVDDAADLQSMRRRVPKFAAGQEFGWRDVLTRVSGESKAAQSGFRLRPARSDDAPLVLSWRNDPVAVAFSKSGIKVDRRVHDRWMTRVLAGPASRLWIGQVGNLPVGQVRVDVKTGIGTVSVGVDPAQRGRGYGTALLEGLKTVLLNDYQIVELIGDVSEDNLPSRRIFLNADFVDEGGHDGFIRFRWRR